MFKCWKKQSIYTGTTYKEFVNICRGGIRGGSEGQKYCLLSPCPFQHFPERGGVRLFWVCVIIRTNMVNKICFYKIVIFPLCHSFLITSDFILSQRAVVSELEHLVHVICAWGRQVNMNIVIYWVDHLSIQTMFTPLTI